MLLKLMEDTQGRRNANRNKGCQEKQGHKKKFNGMLKKSKANKIEGDQGMRAFWEKEARQIFSQLHASTETGLRPRSIAPIIFVLRGISIWISWFNVGLTEISIVLGTGPGRKVWYCNARQALLREVAEEPGKRGRAGDRDKKRQGGDKKQGTKNNSWYWFTSTVSVSCV